LPLDLLRIAVEFGFGSVMSIALAALITLRAGAVATSFNLSFDGLAIATFKHVELYILPMSLGLA
jgi:hypothetical protein